MSSDGCARGRWSERSGHLVTTMPKVQQKKNPSKPAPRAAKPSPAPTPARLPRETINVSDFKDGTDKVLLLTTTEATHRLHGLFDDLASALVEARTSFDDVWVTAEDIAKPEAEQVGDGNQIEYIRKFAARFTDFARLLKTYHDEGRDIIQSMVEQKALEPILGEHAVLGRAGEAERVVRKVRA